MQNIKKNIIKNKINYIYIKKDCESGLFLLQKGEKDGVFVMGGRHTKRMEFSKKILVFASVGNLAVIIFSCFMIYITKDFSPLSYIIPSVSGEVATGIAFYYTKAKTENKIKLMKMYGVQPTEEAFKEY